LAAVAKGAVTITDTVTDRYVDVVMAGAKNQEKKRKEKQASK